METKKIKQPTLTGEVLELRPMSTAYVSKRYVAWLNDPQVNQYLEIRFERATLAGSRIYIKNVLKDSSMYFFAIVAHDGMHIGNIKLGPIDRHHKVASIGLIIGDKDYWGKGYASEAMQLIEKFAFEELKLHKLTAGAYVNNVGSIRLFQKRGFFQEGVHTLHYLFKGKYIDSVFMAKINPSQQ